ncbi:putative tail assembly chaperone protein [Desulfovibrio phage ProddE]|uniref:Tail assembly chaperone protein n=1 Tax=Desulfovibrio phage ProddE TaxID=2866661 RepID=A0AAE8XC58_9CAUD|nr:putative tail assembly chaperone protein [Desulfovibrio phage ProddE]
MLCNAAGDIEMWDAQSFPGSTLVDYEVVRGWDGKLYKAGEEPTPPAPQPVDAPPVIITSDNITIADADFLLAASKAGEKTAEWLIAKLDL